jgi:hypothetical protein
MSTRQITVIILGIIGVGMLILIGYLAHIEGMTLKEAAGWVLAGFLSLREIISKLENVALKIVPSGDNYEE